MKPAAQDTGGRRRPRSRQPGEEPSPRKKAKTATSNRYVTPASMRAWKDLLGCVLDPSANFSETDPDLEVALTQISSPTSDLLKELPDLFSEVIKSFPDRPEIQASGFILCCYFLGVSVTVQGGKEFFSRDSSLATSLPRPRTEVEYEYVLHELLLQLAGLGLDPARVELRQEVTFLKWLQHLAKFIHDNSLPVPVTKVTVKCIGVLLDIHPLCVESLIGQFCAIFLYNIDHVDISEFWRHALHTFLKLRQVPKLVAKLLIAVGKDAELQVSLLARPIREEFAGVMHALPAGQILEMWKTFLYHIEQGVKDKRVFGLIDPLMSDFLQNICVVDHTVPKVTVDKVRDLLSNTQEILAKFSSGDMTEVKQQLCELAVLLTVNRSLPMPESVLQQQHFGRVTSLKMAVVQGRDISGDEINSLDHEDIITHSLLKECSEDKILEISKHLVVTEDSVANTLLLQESTRLQIGVVANVLLYLGDVLDVDSTCEDILRPFGDPRLIFHLDDPVLLEKIRAAFVLLDTSMRGDCTNPELDAKFYFYTPLKSLELLPLESLHPTLNLLVLLVSFSLLSVSAHEDVNERLLVVLARSLDPTFRQSGLSRYTDPSKVFAWISRLSYYRNEKFVNLTLQFLARDLVKYIHEFSDVWPNFSETLDRLALSLKTLENEKSVACVVVLMEALEKPLRYRDAAAEKLEVCEKHFNKFTKSLVEGLHEFPQCPLRRQIMVMRALTAVFSVWNAKGTFKVKPKLQSGIRAVSSTALDHMRDSAASAVTSCRLILALLHLGGDHASACMGGDEFRQNLWKLVTDLELPLQKLTDFQALTTCLLEKSSLNELSDHLGKLIPGSSELDPKSYARLAEILKCLANANLDGDDEAIIAFRQKVLEEALPRMQRACDSNSNDSMQALMQLQLTLLRAKKPLLLRESEARCLVNCLQVNLEELLLPRAADAPTPEFFQTWEIMHEILLTAFLNRTNTLVIPRIPIVIAVFRNLLTGLVRASDQRRNVVPTELKRLVAYAHNLDRILDRIRKLKEDFARVAPYLLADVLYCMQQVPIYPQVKANLTFGVHKLLDICDKHAKEFLAGNFPDGTKELYKQVLENYNQYYKYSGRV